MTRVAAIGLYAVLAALGAALLARPAFLWLYGLGLARPVRPWEVPLGGAAASLMVVLAAFTSGVLVHVARGGKLRRGHHFALLLLVGLALALRAGSGDIRAPADPAPRLIAGLRAASAALDAGYVLTGRYAPDAALIQGALSGLPGAGFVHRGHQLGLSAHILHGMHGPQLEALPGDLPGTIYVAISSDEQRAWFSALSLHRVLPITVEATAGTHSAPGFDPFLPVYPDAPPPSRLR